MGHKNASHTGCQNQGWAGNNFRINHSRRWAHTAGPQALPLTVLGQVPTWTITLKQIRSNLTSRDQVVILQTVSQTYNHFTEKNTNRNQTYKSCLCGLGDPEVHINAYTEKDTSCNQRKLLNSNWNGRVRILPGLIPGHLHHSCHSSFAKNKL